MSSFLLLPAELILFVLSNVDYQSLLRCIEVCRSLHSIITKTLRFRYATRLAVAGMVDGAHSKAVTATRLQNLDAYQDAWNNLAWTDNHTFLIASIRFWELTGGVLGLYHEESSVFHCISIPSKYRAIEYREWLLEGIGIKVEDFTLDPSNDLLVAVSKESLDSGTVFQVHALSLSTGKPHPRASTLVMDIHTRVPDEDWSYELRVYDHHLAVTFSPREIGETDLAIWNWESGMMIARFANASSFAFLSNTLIMLSCVSSQEETDIVAELILLDLAEVQSETSRFSLLLPSPGSGIDIYDVSIFSEPPPASQDARQSTMDAPFTTSPHDRLLVVNFRMFNNLRNEEETYTLFIPLSVCLDYFRMKQTEEIVIPWEEWGPKGTRMLAIDFSDVWVCYVHGMKAVFYERTLQKFHLLDFHQLGIRHDILRDSKREGSVYCTKPSTIGEATDPSITTQVTVAFNECPVTTSLPFRTWSGTLPLKSIEAVMLSEDAIVAVTEGDDAALTVFSF